MSDETNINDATAASTADHEEHSIITAKLPDGAFAAWVEGDPGVAGTGDSRWMAVYQLAFTLSGGRGEA